MNKCAYCGNDNPAEAVNCSSCGSLLVVEQTSAETERRKKSKATAVILALIFGPLGLLYLGGEGLMAVIFFVGIGFFALPLLLAAVHEIHGFGLLFGLVGRVVCVWWALKVLERRDADPDALDADTLLNEAAKLENIDVTQAIASYEVIIKMFPDTSASAEARRNSQTLRSHKS